MLLVDDLAAGGTKNLRHTPRGLVTLIMPEEDSYDLVSCQVLFAMKIKKISPNKPTFDFQSRMSIFIGGIVWDKTQHPGVKCIIHLSIRLASDWNPNNLKYFCTQ